MSVENIDRFSVVSFYHSCFFESEIKDPLSTVAFYQMIIETVHHINFDDLVTNNSVISCDVEAR